MIKINIHKAKTQFSHYLNLVEKGEKVIICKRNVPIAEFCLLPEKKQKRAIGQCKEHFEVPAKFFQPLPKNMLRAFNQPK